MTTTVIEGHFYFYYNLNLRSYGQLFVLVYNRNRSKQEAEYTARVDYSKGRYQKQKNVLISKSTNAKNVKIRDNNLK